VFVDARTVTEADIVDSDVCIVGGGAAGIALAVEMIGTPVRVGLLESGGMQFDAQTQDLYAGGQDGLRYFPLDASRLRYFGGSTNHWGGMSRPFDAEDFQERGEVGDAWPISISDVEPYYARAGSVCGVAEDAWSVGYWNEGSRHATLPLRERFVTRVAQQVPRAARNFGARFERDLERAENVIVYLHANAVGIETDDDVRNVTLIRVATLEGQRFSVAGRHFVLAAGGIENPRLLLASTSRRPNGLGNDHDQVGRYFTEHPRFEAASIAPTGRFPVGFYTVHHARGVSIQGYVGLGDELKREEGLADVQLRLRPVYERSYAEARNSDAVESFQRLARLRSRGVDQISQDVVNILEDLSRWQDTMVAGAPLPIPHPATIEALLSSNGEERSALASMLFGDIGVFGWGRLTDSVPIEEVLVTARVTPVPNPESRITLSMERDALGAPRSHLHWRLSRIDKRSILRTLELFGAELGHAGLGRLGILINDDEDDWPDDTAGGYHHMGTTRMSADPRHGVVDAECRVHGIDNLYVAGSSIFADGGSGTPTLTLVALTLRLADHLSQRLERNA
jgi:choline dehydrogenase-like flavoprotein